jgi:hypothetical protein
LTLTTLFKQHHSSSVKIKTGSDAGGTSPGLSHTRGKQLWLGSDSLSYLRELQSKYRAGKSAGKENTNTTKAKPTTSTTVIEKKKFSKYLTSSSSKVLKEAATTHGRRDVIESNHQKKPTTGVR